MPSTQQLVSEALTAVNGLRQFSVQTTGGQFTSEFAATFKNAMGKVAAALQAVQGEQTTLVAQAVQAALAAVAPDLNELLVTLANVGTGAGLFRDKTGQVANLKTLVAGANVTLTPSADEVLIAATGGGGGASAINDIDGGVVNPYTLAEADITGFDLVRVTFTDPAVFEVTIPADPGGADAFTPGTIVQMFWQNIFGVSPYVFNANVSAPGLVMGSNAISFGPDPNGATATFRYEGNDVWICLGAATNITLV